MSRYAMCADPQTAPDTLAFLATEALSRAEQDALCCNPSLPFNNLFAALADGKTMALRNPSLPLHLLACPLAQGETEDGDEITLSGAVLCCLAHALAELCSRAPRDGGVDVLRRWLFAAIWGASRWHDEHDFVDFIIENGWSMRAQWRDVSVGLFDGIPTGGRLGGSARAIVYRATTRFLALSDLPFLLALANDIALLGVDHDGERYLTDVRAAARLLGCEAPPVTIDPNQLDLFAAEAP